MYSVSIGVKVYKVILSLFGVLFYFSFHSQITYKNYTVDDGLPSSTVYRVIQDKKGFIWIATAGGISRFDGYTFTNYTVGDGLLTNDVWDLYEDHTEKVWLLDHHRNLSYLFNDSIHSIEFSENENKWGIEYIRQDKKGNYWISEGKSLLCLYGNKRTIYNKKNSPIERLTFFLFEDEKGILWFADESSVYIKKDHTLENISLFMDGLGHFNPNPRMFSSNSKIVNFTSKKGIFSYSTKHKKIERISLEKDIEAQLQKDLTIISIANSVPDMDYFFLQTNHGLLVLDTNFKKTDVFDAFEQEEIGTVLQDREGNFWLTSLNNGLFFIPNGAKNVKNYTHEQGLSDNDVLSVVVDTNGTVFLGTEKGYINTLEQKNNAIRKIKLDNDNSIIKLNFNTAGELIAQSHNGIYFLNKKLLEKGMVDIPSEKEWNTPITVFNEQIALGNSFSKYLIYTKDFFVNAKQIVLQGTPVGLIKIYHRYPHNDTVERINTLRIQTLIEDHDRAIWLGNSDGLFKMINDSTHIAIDTYDVLTKSIKSLQVDSSNILWIGTDGFGLCGYNAIKEQIYFIDELRHHIINHICIGADNTLWVATNKGVKRIQFDKASPLNYHYHSITRLDGILSNEVNQIQTKDDKIYIASRKGLSVMNINNNPTTLIPPPVYFTHIKIGSDDVTLKKKYKLNYKENKLTINYVGLSYQSQTQIEYLYRLEGRDQKWNSTYNTEIIYPNLAPGDYTFEVKAKTKDGEISKTPARIVFTIAPPWWSTWWLRTSIILAMALTVYLLVRTRIRLIRKKETEKTVINKKFAALELQALQSQMNPHFVFNCLNAIQNFILDKDEKTANRYLSKFAQVMRLFLESSQSNYLPLSEEIKLLTLYIDLEKICFDDQFNYHIKIPTDLYPKNIDIPVMLLQPIVENAINHGLAYKKTKGELKLSFSINDKQLICVIKDNGIGRAKAMEIKNRSQKSYRSRGTQIIQERVNLLNSAQKKNFIQINTEDLVDIDQKSIGTSVTIKMDIF